jgi:lipoteichoic acid synthase
LGRGLLSRRDWVYLLGLLIPFVVYNLILKASDVASWPEGGHGFATTLDLMRSDMFFNLGYALLWIGLFAIARIGPLRWVVVVLFHATAVLVLLVTTSAHWYFQETGNTLDYSTITEWPSKLDLIEPILFQGGGPVWVWMLLAMALLYAALGPFLLARVIDRRPQRSSAETTGSFFGVSLVPCFLALGFGSLSLLAGFSSTGADTSLAMDPFVNVALTGIEGTTAEKDQPDSGYAAEHPAAHARLAQTPQTEKRNVVLIHLESTRAQSVTPYNQDLKTTPFLDQLAKSSLLAERAYVVLPRSSKGSVAINCGIEPPLYPGPEFEPNEIPAPCLASLLKDQGYRTVFFQSNSNSIDNFRDVTKGFGYEEFYPTESMDTEGFQVTNTFGYEDDIMLRPSEGWLRAYGYDKPFMAEYLTGTGHYGYECIPNRYGTKDFSEDEQLNRYLNCLRYLDFFLNNLFDQYKKLGLYDNTIFVIFGDHGEGFEEHGRTMHGDTIWDEGLKIPLIIHDPKRFEDGQRVEGLSSQIDILPTVLEMLGYEVKNGKYPGYSLLHSLPEDRTLRFGCISGRMCLASMKGNEKYIYHFDKRPEEVFNVSKDPSEKRNLASLYSNEELDRRRNDLVAWRSRVNAQYGDILINGTPYSESTAE